jgi:hypothetical protein
LIKNSLRVLADQSFDAYEHPLEVLARHPDTRACVVDYRDLVSRPAITMRRVYDELGLEFGSAAAEAVASAQGQGHESTHRYSLAEFGLDPNEIHIQLADLFERFNWDTEGEDARVH